MRHARALVPNPAWVTDIIAQSYGSLQEMGTPPRWMPRMDDMRAQGQRGISARVTEYGCGAYGCVFPTLDPGMVMKVTQDDTEAEFAANLANTLDRPICVAYHMVIRLDVKHNGDNVYLLWREAADHVGKIAEVIQRENGQGEQAMQLINAQHAAAQEAYRAMRGLEDPEVIARLVSTWLATCEAMARQIKAPQLRKLGDGLVEVYNAQRVFFGDIHSGNLGMVHRPDGDHWVITDPGHVAVVDPY